MKQKPDILRIDINYALLQAVFWIAYCSLGAFTAVYLSYRGLNNTQIGLTTSLTCAISIVMQLILSDFSDRHYKIPIKRIISILFAAAIVVGIPLYLLDLPAVIMIPVFSLTLSVVQSNNAYLNAQLMQFNNVGIMAHYGWPRGCGSVSYALAAYVFGIISDKYSAGVLLPIFIVGVAICIVVEIFMPNPYKGIDYEAYGLTGGKKEHISYIEMLKGNRTLLVFLICAALLGAGQGAGFTFMIRVVEELGGSSREYGVSELIRAGVEVPMLFGSALVLKKFSGKTLVTISFLAQALRIFIIASAVNLGMVYLASAMNMFCSGIYLFAAVLFVNSITGPRESVRAQSLATLCLSLGAIVGNSGAGVMIDTIGLHPMLYIASSICALAGVIMILFCRVPEKKRNHS